MFGFLGFLASNTHLASRNPKFRTEIEPKCGENPFFGLYQNFGAKIRTEIKLLSLTNFAKTFRPLEICLINKKSTPM